MGSGPDELTGPDLTAGVALADVADGGMLLGQAHGEAVLLARKGNDVFALGAKCTHYGGPLAEGVFDGEMVRCPWHHACFDVRTGVAVRAPALNPVACWRVERRGNRVAVTEKVEREPLAPAPSRSLSARAASLPTAIVIIGAGAAGSAAAEMLRREAYAGRITVLDPDDTAPYDRPNLSKDYLAGNAPEEWIPIRPDGFYAEHGIDLVRGAKVERVDPAGKRVHLAGGAVHPFDRLLLATGATPVRLPIPGSDRPSVRYLRTLADSRAIIRAVTGAGAKRAVVVGASFIGLEVAASLRARNVEVHVVAPESRPLERVMGPELGDFIRALHEEHGVVFHLERKPTSIGDDGVAISSGEVLPAEIVVMGVGVRPSLELAEQAGLAIDRGVSVNEYLETSAPGIYAAGDIARWPDPHSGERIRVEHWVVAQRQGQAAARNMLAGDDGAGRVAFTVVPFFWSQHYDVPINYVGHAERWDRIQVDGDISARDCAVSFIAGGKVLAKATIYRDRESLQTELEMERGLAL